MLAGKGFLRTEYGSDLEDALETACHRHLLIELGALRKIGFPAEILDLENVRSALAGCADELRGMNLDEILIEEALPHCIDKAGLYLKEKLVFIGAKVDPAVVEPLVDSGTLDRLLFLGRRYILADDGERIGNGFNYKLSGQKLDAAHLYIFILANRADDGYDAVGSDLRKLIKKLGAFFFFNRYLKLARYILDNDKSHALAVTEILDKALNLGDLACLGSDITNQCSFHNSFLSRGSLPHCDSRQRLEAGTFSVYDYNASEN